MRAGGEEQRVGRAVVAEVDPATEGDGWGVESPDAWGRLYRGDAGEPVPAERGRWDTYYPAFAAAVLGTAPVPVDPADVVRNVEALDAARESATKGRTISL